MPTSSLPTAQEVLASNESKVLYRTNLLRLQLDELRGNITPSYKKLTKVDKLVSLTCQYLHEIKSKKISKDTSSEYTEVSLRGLLIDDITVEKPVFVDVVGSYKSESMVKPLHNIDVAVGMPPALLSERDIKSYRCFDKRKLYCAEIARQLQAKLSGYSVSLENWQGDMDKPIVVVSVQESAWRIQVFPCTAPTTFMRSKLTSDYKNLDESKTCDPLYNASILEDMYFNSDVFDAPRHVNFTQGVQMIKVWLYRRRLLVTYSNFSGLSGFQIRALLSHVCHNLPREVSAYQMFKLFISLLANTNWRTTLIVHSSTTTRVRTDSGLAYPIMEVQQLESYNPLWRVPLAIMGELSIEASQSLTFLDDASIRDPFEALFCQTSRERDFSVRVPFAGKNPRVLAEDIGRALTTGLASRLSKSQIYVSFTSEGFVTVRGDIESSTASVTVEKGPSADSSEAAKFRSFWGQKAELRRFRDGSILECAVWDSKQGPVAEQIIKYVVGTKFSLENVEIFFSPLGACQPVSRSHIALWSALETLRTKLTSIAKLPISIVSLRPSHARFTGTDLVSSTGVLAPLDCIVEFESSQAWPSNRFAVWHAKCAFLLAIREGLMAQYCAVELGAEEMSEEPFADVRMMDNTQVPFAFRLRIFANVERQRLMAQLASVDNPPTLCEVATVGQLWFGPMLRARIHAISAGCPAITGAISQAKAWLDNHMILQPWLEDWVEVTMAHVIESKGVSMVPQSPHVALLDWFFFLANHSYRTEPVFAKLASEENEMELLQQRFELAVESRRSWWVSSDIDPDCLFMRRPTEWEAQRIKKLAAGALEKARNEQWDLIKFGTDNSRIFDIIVKINPEFIQAMDEHVKVLAEQFRKYLGVHYSKQHGIIGLLLEPQAFRPQSKTVLEKSKMLTVVDELAVPDITALVAKLGAFMKGVAESIRVRA